MLTCLLLCLILWSKRATSSVGRDALSVKNKRDLPSKLCFVCGRPFSWRKKWQRCWQDVKYCSKRCRSLRSISSLTKQ
ncbi:DUF2256 domain-containing protein [Vibrio panuliri]|uniref:DUF2256 domain-containing protein n=1 Tax=Vibrio panuliri TaxID=1381081 RepID=UPI00384BB226